jgi:hypothetical protein
MKRSNENKAISEKAKQQKMIELEDEGFEMIEANAVIEGKLTKADIKFLDEHPVVIGTVYRKARGRMNTPLSDSDVYRGKTDKATTRRGVLETVDTELGFFVIDKDKTLAYEDESIEHKQNLKENEQIRNSQKVGDLSKLLQGRVLETEPKPKKEAKKEKDSENLHWKEAVKLIGESDTIEGVRYIAEKSSGKSVENAVAERIKELKEQE